MKRFISLMLALAMLFCLAACNKKKDEEKDESEKGKDETVKIELDVEDDTDAEDDEKPDAEVKTLKVGVTEYQPFNYKDEFGNWTGFDTEFALLVAEELGMKVQFEYIDWNEKFDWLSEGKVDCIWNALTINSESTEKASVTDPYVRTSEVIVMKTENVDNYPDLESMSDLRFAVESESYGHEIAYNYGLDFVEYTSVDDALLAVSAGKADACIIDLFSADDMTGEGNDYYALSYKVELEEEKCGIAFPKGSELTAKVNEIIGEMKADGRLEALGNKYKLVIAE